MPIDALLLQAMQLEEVCEPEHILHQIDVFTLLLAVTRRPKHFIRVHKVEYDAERARRRPQRQQNPNLLSFLDAGDDFTELLGLLQEVLLKREKFDILNHKANLVARVVRVLVTLTIIIAFLVLLMGRLLLILIGVSVLTQRAVIVVFLEIGIIVLLASVRMFHIILALILIAKGSGTLLKQIGRTLITITRLAVLVLHVMILLDLLVHERLSRLLR